MAIIIKIHKAHDGRKIVALCDKSLLGRKFEEGKLHLDLSSDFYKGAEKDGDFVVSQLKNAKIINIAGKESIELCIKLGIVDKRNIIYIDKIQHAQALLG